MKQTDMKQTDMEETKPSSIKVIGLLIIIFSSFMIFSNVLGLLVNWSMESDFVPSEISNENQDPISFDFDYFVLLGLLMMSIGISFLIGGIYIRKYRLWANKMVTVLSSFIILIIWGLMITIFFVMGQIEQMNMMKYGALLNALIWSTPLIITIWYLNKKRIRMHFY